MPPIQHKREAYWFYFVVSRVYDRWVNPLFWTARMRTEALELARLGPGMDVVDVGAGTGFATEGIVELADAERVTLLDQSPHQLAQARAKPELARCTVVRGDAEDLPFATDSADRYVSTGSIEYWPDPQRGIAEAYRVLRPGGIAMLAGPVLPAHPLARRLADAWMLFPEEDEYRAWFAAAGFTDIEVRRMAPDWFGGDFAVAIAGRKVTPGHSPVPLAPPEPPDAPLAALRRGLRRGSRVRPRRAGALAARAAPAPVRPLVLLWRFGRPHTLIGTTLSVLGVYVLVAVDVAEVGDRLGDLLATLVAAWSVNIFITGINQLTDVEIDRINKPFLPIAAGDLSPRAGRWIVAGSAALPIAMALTQGWIEIVAVLAGLVVGVAYSLPPLRLKRWPALAALSISGVRALVVNLGVALHFSDSLAGVLVVPAGVWVLTAFVAPFSAAIALLKDVPDIEGDRRYRIATYSVRLGGAVVLRAGLALLGVAYVGIAIAAPFLLDGWAAVFLAGSHLLVLAALIVAARRTDPADRAVFTGFYMFVWKLFFLEYVIVPLAWLMA
jgi:4-hydroxybenzoate polyprenyltransferase/SAM-dependent methyltransferase